MRIEYFLNLMMEKIDWALLNTYTVQVEDITNDGDID